MQIPEASVRPSDASGTALTSVSASRQLAEIYRRIQRGQVSDGLAELAALRVEAARVLSELDTVILVATMVECRLARGDLADAMALGDELTAYLADDALVGAVAHSAKGELASALGDPVLAADHFVEASERADGASPSLVPWRAGAALALLRSGQRQEAAALAREHVVHARTSGSDYAVAQALRTLATADISGDRVRTLRDARAALTDTVADRLAAQIDTDLAGLLLLTHDPALADEALELLRSAEEYAGRQELWPLQSRVRRLLDRMGQEPHRFRTEALAALTASERRVARLAADGRTNRQIAEELVVTVKAVEWHLSHVYRKLGIGSRTALPGALGAAV